MFAGFLKSLKRLSRISDHFSVAQQIGIDLGTANTLVYVKNRGIVLNEPSVVAVIHDRGFEVPYLFGAQAKMMMGKTPDKISIHKPLQDGVIADSKVAEDMIKYFVNSAISSMSFVRPTIIVCVPFESTIVERYAIQESVMKCGAKDVFLIEEPMAAAIGARLPISEPTGSMVVDIGGGTTEIAVVSLSGIVSGRSLKVAGTAFDKAICNYIKQKSNLLIGLSTAEQLKKTIGVAFLPKNAPNNVALIRGRDLITGTPKEIEVCQEDVANAISPAIREIADAVMSTLEDTGPELSADIVSRGIVLTGGGGLLENLDSYLRNVIGLPTFVANRPLCCVTMGLGIVLDNKKKYEHVLFQQT